MKKPKNATTRRKTAARTSTKTKPHGAAGKIVDAAALERAERGAVAGARRRIEEGHRAARRTPPSDESASRRSGSSWIDDSIRDRPLTSDEKLLQSDSPASNDYTQTDPWRVTRMTAEIVEGFDTLADVQRGVSIFGSARTKPTDCSPAASAPSTKRSKR